MTRTLSIGNRGRVPFALVGVLILVTSATFVATYRPTTPTAQPEVDVAVDRTSADARSALRDAAGDAAVAAASEPVLTPANSSTGDLLTEDRAFRDALELRIYRAAHRRLGSLERTHRGVRTNASLPPTSNASALEHAKERVTIDQAGPNETRLEVAVENVSIRAYRDGREVGERTITLTIVVDSPVLAVHDHVSEYERKLNNGFDRPGFDRRLTARLYAVAWARGYAQYGGVSIENVVGNRHVELMANGALLGTQRSVFGRSDPDGHRALRTATAQVGLQDLLAATGSTNSTVVAEVDDRLRDATASANDEEVPRLADGEADVDGADVDAEALDSVADGTAEEAADETMTVDVGTSADVAFGSFVQNGTINRTVDSVYEASVRRAVTTESLSSADPPPPAPPADGEWGREADRTDVEVVGVEGSNVTLPTAGTRNAGAHRLRTIDRTVTLRHVRTSEWHHVDDGRVETTSTNATERRRVTVALSGRHARTPHAPTEPIRTIHEPAGRLAGENLADVTRTAEETFVVESGGPDGLAAAAALGEIDRDRRTVEGKWPIALRRAIYDDLVTARESVRNVSVEVSRGRLGTYRAEPARELADRVRDRRRELLESVGAYDTAADKARVAAEARYLETVVENLEGRARIRDRNEEAFDERLADSGVGSLSLIRRAYDNRDPDPAHADPGGLSLHVDAAPAYLTVSAVEHEQTAAIEPDEPVHPMVARNVNVASIPYAEVSDTILGFLLGDDETPMTRIGTAASALEASNRTLERTGNESLRPHHQALEDEVERRINRTRDRLEVILAAWDFGGAQSEAFDDAFEEWGSTRARAEALANGSMAESLAAAAERHAGEQLTERERDAIRVSARTALQDITNTSRAQVPGSFVNETATRISEVASDRLRDAIERGDSPESVASTAIPSGIPITPIPGHWYATANVWVVEAEGRYERFAVETPRRSPARGAVSLSYVRDGSNVTLDADGDGTEELLGTADRVSFSVETAVVVAVPPGKSGVGDVDGDRDERSPGWPDPGPVNGTADGSTGGAGPSTTDSRADPVRQGEIDRRNGHRPGPVARPRRRARQSTAAIRSGDPGGGSPEPSESDSNLYRECERSIMLRGEFESAGERAPGKLRAAYESRLRETVESIGVETVARRSGVDRSVLESLTAGDSPELTLEAAAAILAADPERPAGDVIEAEALDILLMGMTTAVVDVDAVAAGLDGEMDPKEIQQKVEGRYPITLAEYARVHRFLEAD